MFTLKAIPTVPDPAQRTDVRVIFALWLVHFTGDLYASFVSPLLPAFADVFSLSLAQVGLIAGLNRFLMFIVQPLAGYYADHHRTRLFILGGPLLSIVFIPLVGVAPNYAVLLLFVALGSIGQSMFHPPVAGMIAAYAGRNFSLCMSVFNAGGTMAFGVGPILITALVAAFGMPGTVYSMGIGLPLMALLYHMVPRPQGVVMDGAEPTELVEHTRGVSALESEQRVRLLQRGKALAKHLAGRDNEPPPASRFGTLGEAHQGAGAGLKVELQRGALAVRSRVKHVRPEPRWSGGVPEPQVSLAAVVEEHQASLPIGSLTLDPVADPGKVLQQEHADGVGQVAETHERVTGRRQQRRGETSHDADLLTALEGAGVAVHRAAVETVALHQRLQGYDEPRRPL